MGYSEEVRFDSREKVRLEPPDQSGMFKPIGGEEFLGVKILLLWFYSSGAARCNILIIFFLLVVVGGTHAYRRLRWLRVRLWLRFVEVRCWAG